MNLYISKKDEMTDKNIVVDDMFLTTDMPTTAGSKMLENYMSLFEASVIGKLKENGCNVYAKANTGEMGIDLLGETSNSGACAEDGVLKNACAEIVKSKEAKAAVVFDVNGAPARAAAINDLVYIKPTYGTVSRFGTIPAACSGETVGVMADSADVCREVLSAIAGHDDKDGTSLPQEKCDLLKADAERAEIKKIAVAKSLVALADDETKSLIEKIKDAAEVEEIDAEKLLLAKAAWNVLMSAEVCNNVSRYDGVKYGYRSKDYKNIDELYTNSRTESFGFLLKSTILYGSDCLSTDNYMKVYDKALRIRRVLSEYLNELLTKYDAILLPACSKRAFTEAEAQANPYIAYDESAFTAPAAITGLPAVTVSGVQFIGKAFSENSLLDLASKITKGGKI